MLKLGADEGNGHLELGVLPSEVLVQFAGGLFDDPVGGAGVAVVLEHAVWCTLVALNIEPNEGFSVAKQLEAANRRVDRRVGVLAHAYTLRVEKDGDETIIPNDDTVIRGDETVVSVPEGATVTEVSSDHTVVPEYNTLIGSMLDNSVIGVPSDETVAGVDETIVSFDDTVITLDEVTRGREHLVVDVDVELVGHLAGTETALVGDTGIIDDGDTAPIQRFQLRDQAAHLHPLKRPLVIGRMPRAPRQTRTPVALLVVESPEGVVSGNHVMIEALGDVVVVTDLRSTNGTRVILPGRPSVQLAPGDSLAVGAGAVVDIGDGNRLEVLGLN